MYIFRKSPRVFLNTFDWLSVNHVNHASFKIIVGKGFELEVFLKQKASNINFEFYTFFILCFVKLILCVLLEAVAQSYSVKKMFLVISQNSQENTCARAPFLIKLQAIEKGNSDTGEHLWNTFEAPIWEHLFLQNSSGDCFCPFSVWKILEFNLWLLPYGRIIVEGNLLQYTFFTRTNFVETTSFIFGLLHFSIWKIVALEP